MTNWLAQRLQRHWLWLLINVAALLPLIYLARLVVAAPALPGPLFFVEGIRQEILLLSGKIALTLLVLSLTCTPLARIGRLTGMLKVRKSLGLWGFGYSCFHALFFLEGKQLLIRPPTWQAAGQAWELLTGLALYESKVPYAKAGIYALVLISPLALTSNRLAMRWLGKRWKQLHRLIYLALPVAIYHYWWRQQVMEPVETPAYWHPFTFTVVVGLLLLVRIPPVYRRLATLVNRVYWGKTTGGTHRSAAPVSAPRIVVRRTNGLDQTHSVELPGCHPNGQVKTTPRPTEKSTVE